MNQNEKCIFFIIIITVPNTFTLSAIVVWLFLCCDNSAAPLSSTSGPGTFRGRCVFLEWLISFLLILPTFLPPISILIVIRWIYLGYGRSEEKEKKIHLTACHFCAIRANEELNLGTVFTTMEAFNVA